MSVHDTLLGYLYFENHFHLDADASKTQLNGTEFQVHGAIAYHSRRLTKYQEKYSTPEKKALSIVDMLKTHSSTLLGSKTHVNVDALNSLGNTNCLPG